MDISIIVPVYNVEKYLDRCLESLLEQEKVETEILIIDDGSTDNSGKISDIYQKKYNNIYVYHKKNEGLGLTRNYGMDRARGDYILFVDSDDYIKKNSLYDLIDFMKKRKLDVAFFGRNIDKQGKIVLGHDFFPKNMPEYKELAGLSLGEPLKSDRYEIGPAWKAIYRKNFLNDKNLYFESERICLSEDYLFSANLLINKPKVGFWNDNLYFYCDNGSSLTNSFNPQRPYRAVVLYRKMEEIIQCAELDNIACMRAYNNFVINLLVSFKHIAFYDHLSFIKKINEIKKICLNREIIIFLNEKKVINNRKLRILQRLILKKHFFLIYFFMIIRYKR